MAQRNGTGPATVSGVGSPTHYYEMGYLVAGAGRRDRGELTAEYGAELMDGLAAWPVEGLTGIGHVNGLQPLHRHPVPEWPHQQLDLHPYLKELMLRKHP